MTGPVPAPGSGTGELRIETRFHSEALNRLAVPVEIRGADLSVVGHALSGQTVGGLDPGRTYYVSAQLPGGHLLTREVLIPADGDQPGVAVLEPSPSAQAADPADEVAHFIGTPAHTLLPAAQPGGAPWHSPAAVIVHAPAATAAEAAMVLESLGATGPATADVPGDAVAALLGEYARLDASAEAVPAAPPAVLPDAPPAPVRADAGGPTEVQVRIFRGNALTSEVVPQPVAGLRVTARHANAVRIGVPGADGLWFVQVLQAGRPGVNVALPVSRHFGCDVLLSVLPGDAPDAVSLDVHMADVDANALLRYQALGLATEAATSVASPDPAADLRRLLAGNGHTDAVAAVVRGYALLRLNRVAELDPFTEVLHHRFDWLPDGAAVRGEYLARMGRHAEAVVAFLDAVDRGLPLFNEGLSTIVDRLGLYLTTRDGLLTSAQAERIRGVLALLQRYCGVTDMRKMLVRFTGLTPCAPGLDLVPALRPGDDAPTRMTLTFPLTTPPSPSLPGGPADRAEEETMDVLADLSATEQRFADRTAERTRTEQRIAEVRRGERSVLQVDDPQRVALRTQRVLAQPVVRESLGGVPGGPLESLGTVAHDRLLERVIGGDNLLGVAFLELGSAVAHSVGRIHIRDQFSDRGFGTGFLISPRVLLTNNHVFPTAASARFSQVEFRFENGVDGRPRTTSRFDLQPDALFLTHRELDFSVVAVSEQSRADGGPPQPLARFGFNRISRDQGKILLGESINIVQHPDGRPKQVALQQNELVDRLDDFLHYRTDTAPGSSGSPLYNNQWEVVGLHHSGVPERNADGAIMSVDGTPWTAAMGTAKIKWTANEGARISSIIAWLESAAGTVPEEPGRLLREALSPPTEAVLPTAPRLGEQSVAAPAATPEITVTVPLHITVRVGGAG
ncbi:trypsin-like serine peptidase [Jidongwangia harbinensis]|uniref:trypsin-like serine peptidase n=1 Tax=Jidongwangia harbinensis TaxID=2878561 RepID=UPI001CD97CA8|nr:serine protease [Jidongwangia harbinensis]MCA2217348.1 serine protease [Jidongwangia harbinensis]